MVFFGDSKPKVSHKEFHHVKNYLSTKGFSHNELTALEGFFHGDLSEGGDQAGISKHEAERTIEWLREHRHHHTFNDDQIGHIEHAVNKYL